ncbi:MAG: beta-hydroxyacyl-ACP dehydratase [Planctomycetes bacterium]|nr:beta-hydroxyacyl-ACP dehydratase [Planctomycetota bacterium]
MRWIWIDRFIDFQPHRSATAVKNVSLAEEHLHDHWAACPIMPFSLMIEGVAQTRGILVGHARGFAEKVILAKIAKAELNAVVRPGDQLIYHAEITNIAEGAAAVAAEIRRGGEVIGTVDLMFSHIDQNLSGMTFPKENFVFTDQFLRLLAQFTRESGT